MTDQRLMGKAALVTGSSRGIGRAIALRFAREGADVAVNYSRDEAAARDVLAEAEASGRRGILIKANVNRRGRPNAEPGAARDGVGDVGFWDFYRLQQPPAAAELGPRAEPRWPAAEAADTAVGKAVSRRRQT